jgi:hypothetical protein
MAEINYALVFNETLVPSKEGFVLSVDKESVEILKDNYAKPIPFFSGAVLALILALPFWSVLFWFIFS